MGMAKASLQSDGAEITISKHDANFVDKYCLVRAIVQAIQGYDAAFRIKNYGAGDRNVKEMVIELLNEKES